MQNNPLVKFFLLDKTFGIVLALTFIISGLLAYTSMVRENYPDLAIPQATIFTEWPGASAQQVEKEITKPLEEKIRALPNLKEYHSSSQNSASILTVEFEAEADLSTTMQRLRARVDEAEAEFPHDAEKPEIEQVSVNDLPIMTLALYGEADHFTLNFEADRLKRALEQVKGVRKVNLQGAHDQVVHIRLDPQALRSLGLSPTDVRDRISLRNQDMSWGRMQNPKGTLPLYLEGRFDNIEDIKNLVIFNRDGEQVIRLRDLARVYKGLEDPKGETKISFNGGGFQSAIGLSIQKRPGEDTLAVIERVRDYIETHKRKASLPANLTITETNSEGEQINYSFNEIQSNLLQGVIAVFVILLFALTWREASVAALAMPIALLAALMIIHFGGFTLNSLVLIGMVIALGLLVDVFILVMEGMHEQLYMKGKSFNEAAIETVKQFFMPALAGQATTILAMTPLITIGGIDGKFIKLIPLTTIVCLVTSLIIAFLLCIPLSRFVLEKSKDHQHSKTKIDTLTEKAAAWLQNTLTHRLLKTRLRASGISLIALTAFIFSLALMDTLPTIVYPKEDRRPVGITLDLKPDASLVDAKRIANKAGAALKDKAYFTHVMTHAGELSPYALGTIDEYLLDTEAFHLVGISALFTPKAERQRAAYRYLEEIRETVTQALKDEAGVTIRISADVGGSESEDPVQIRVFGEDMGALRDIATNIKAILKETGGATDIRANLGPLRTELRFKADESALSFYGLNEADLMEQIRIATSDDKIGTFSMPGAQPDLDIKLSKSFDRDVEAQSGIDTFYELETLSVQTQNGDFIPIFSLVALDVQPVATSYVHAGGMRSVTVQSRLLDGVTALEVIEAITPALAAQAESWPEGYRFEFGGEAASAEETYGNTNRALIVAVLMVFAVLALLFSSFSQPFIIMMIAPLALTGMGIGFYLLQIPFSFPAMIGVIALVGIVVNDSIVMVNVMNSHRARGMDIFDAAAHGASDRLRPILTTSITTIAGLLPLAFSSPAWFPLCMAVIWGLGFSTVLALIVIPALYVLLTGKAGHSIGGQESGPETGLYRQIDIAQG